ncbi:MAG: response regulator [Nitriliruptorales bacterium]
MRVLLVEDEDQLAQVITLNLELAEFDVVRARDGGEGVHLARERDPNVILLDVMMPVLDGWQVLRKLKQEEQTRDVPVIMLTALAEEHDFIQGHLQGAIRYVTKPFEMRDLVATIEDALGPPDEEELARRKDRVRTLLQRLAELDSGRSVTGPEVRLSRLETAKPREAVPAASEADRRRLAELTPKQRYLASQLAVGRSARDLAEELGVSRSNVYAARKRIARKLGVPVDHVANEAKRLGL